MKELQDETEMRDLSVCLSHPHLSPTRFLINLSPSVSHTLPLSTCPGSHRLLPQAGAAVLQEAKG